MECKIAMNQAIHLPDSHIYGGLLTPNVPLNNGRQCTNFSG